MNTLQLTIKGIHCSSCKALIEDVCADIPGVVSCEVNVKEATARVEHDETVAFETIRRAIEELGEYRVALQP